MDDVDHQAERLLRALRPEPRADFVRELEESLLANRRGRERFRVLLAGAALCMSLAAVALVLSIAGLLPGTTGGSRPVEAESPCKTTVVTSRERRPVLVVGRDGEIRTETRTVTVRKPVKRCP
jgi:hypothetical protein